MSSNLRYPRRIVVLLVFCYLVYFSAQGLDCNVYDGLDKVEVSSFDQLSCAIDETVPYINVNTSFAFDNVLTINQITSMKITGDPDVSLTGPVSHRLFNITDSINLVFSGLNFIGGMKTDDLHGAMFYIQSSSVNFTSVSFYDGHGFCSGGIFAKDSKLDINNANFTYNTASEQTTCSGSLQAVQSELNIINSYFYNNSAPYGAAIYAGQSKVNISDTVFLENTAYLGNGGAINLVTSTAMMSRISSFNNSAVGNGGLFNAEQGSRLIVSDLVCVGNKITGSGGCINVIGSDITVNNVRSEYCEALEGGAFSIAENSVLNITNSVISNNYGSSGGGGVFCSQQAEFYGEELVLDGNKADASGGGVSATYGCVFHMVDSVLNGNVIDENAPSSIGGGLYAFGAILVLENITLSYSQGGRGSMLFSQNSLVSIANSDFFFGSSDEYGIYASTATDFSFLNSTYRENKGTLTSSGIMCASTTSCFIYNSVFENNVGKNLGVVGAELCKIEIDSCTFTSNENLGSGGAVYLYTVRDSTITNSTFSHNSAGTYGGAIIAEIETNVVIQNCGFLNNTASEGGALYIYENSQVSVFNSRFDSNKAPDSGGSVYLGLHSEFNVSDSVFNDSQSSYGGAVYASYRTHVHLDNVEAVNNKAGFIGGVLAMVNNVFVKITNSNFTNNRAALGGAVAAEYQTHSVIIDSSFIGNTVSDFGGFAYVLVGSKMEIYNSDMKNNNANYGGGAVFLESSELNIYDSSLSSNYGDFGSGIYLVGALVTIKGSYIHSNGRISTSNGGFAYLSTSSILRSHNNIYASNTALYGGTWSMFSSSLISDQDEIKQCRGYTGGCVYAIENSTVDFNVSTFENNIAEANSGSVLYTLGGKLTLSSSTFLDNFSRTLSSILVYSSDTLVENCTFSSNGVTASGKGGILYFGCTTGCQLSNSSVAIIKNSIFTNNSAAGGQGGAIYIDSYNGLISVENSLFQRNSALYGGAISVADTVVNLKYSDFKSNSAIGGGGGGVYWVYDSNYQVTIKDCTSSDDRAAYGPFKATNLVRLNVSSLDIGKTEVSGQELTYPIYVDLLDNYGQLVTVAGSDESTVYCSVVNDTGTIRGSSIVTAINGTADFSELTLTSNPGSFISLSFNVPVSNVAGDLTKINFRYCVSGEITSSAGDGLSSCVKCGLGTYSFDPTDTSCSICPENVYCPGGNVLDLDDGYWRVDQTSDTIYECSLADVCNGGTNTSTQCATGYTGSFCSVCDDNYVKNSLGTCYECSNPNSVIIQMISSILFFFAILLALIIFKYKKKIKALFNRFSNWFTEKINKIMENRKFRTLRVKGRIIVAFFQIIFQVGPSMNVVFPSNFRNYMNYYSFFELDLINLPNIRCAVNTNYYGQLIMTTVSPVIVFICAAIGIQFLVIRAHRMNERNPSYTVEKARRDTIMVSFLITYFVLVDVSTKIFQVFQCETFDDGESYLVADYSINCNSSDRNFYLAYGALMIIFYPIGIPLVYGIVLFQNRTKINPSWRLVIDGKEKTLVSNKVIQHEKIKVRNTYPEIKNIKFLFDSYVPKRWYFELFDTARRLTLGAIPVLIFRGTAMQIIIVLLVSLLSVGCFMHFNPYIHYHDNELAIVAQWSITLVLISALIIKVDAMSSDNSHRSFLGVILILLNLMVIGFAVASAFLHSKAVEGEDKEDDGDDDDADSVDHDDDYYAHKFSISKPSDQPRETELNPIHRPKHMIHEDSDSDDEYYEERKESSIGGDHGKNGEKSKTQRYADSDDENDSD